MKLWLISLFTCLSSVLWASNDTLTLFNKKMATMPFNVIIYQLKSSDTLSIAINGGKSDVIHISIWDEDRRIQYVNKVYIIDGKYHLVKIKLPSQTSHQYSIDIECNKDGTLFTQITTK